MSVWYLPPAGSMRSYVSELQTMFDRAALFAPGFVRPWLFWIVFVGVLPLVALLAIRCLACAASGQSRRLALWLYVVAVLTGAAWSLITPPFQAPDEVDHFAYVQSLAERGQKPSMLPPPGAQRWSSAEQDALLGTDMLTDHQLSDSRAPELPVDVAAYRSLVARTHPQANDGGGPETTASYGPLYYLALTPAYLLTSGDSVFTQLEAERLISALIAALAPLFAYLMVREIAPRQVWLAVMASLLVAFEPMYGFLSGSVNNDLGVDAGAAAVAYLLVRILRRGPEPWALAALGLVLGTLPFVKLTGYELYPLAGLALAGSLLRTRSLTRGWRAAALGLAGLAVTFVAGHVGGAAVNNAVTPPVPPGGPTAPAPTAGSALVEVLHQPTAYLAYLWEIFLPRLPGMAPHFPPGGLPAQTIFIVRGWAAFGWYDTFFPTWVYRVLDVAMPGALVLGLLAIWRERRAVLARWAESTVIVLFPIVVFAGFEAAFFTVAQRPVIGEMGRYEFPALAPLAALGAAALLALGRRRVIPAATCLLVLVLAFSYASQVLTLTAFFS